MIRGSAGSRAEDRRAEAIPGREKEEELMAMAKAVTSYRKLLAFGKIYGVDTEEDYKAAAKTYAEQAALIAVMRKQLAEDGMTVEKEYVKGRANVCVHPLVQEIPKHVDSANRTLSLINDIIVKRGKAKPPEEDALSEFRMKP